MSNDKFKTVTKQGYEPGGEGWTFQTDNGTSKLLRVNSMGEHEGVPCVVSTLYDDGEFVSVTYTNAKYVKA